MRQPPQKYQLQGFPRQVRQLTKCQTHPLLLLPHFNQFVRAPSSCYKNMQLYLRHFLHLTRSSDLLLASNTSQAVTLPRDASQVVAVFQACVKTSSVTSSASARFSRIRKATLKINPEASSYNFESASALPFLICCISSTQAVSLKKPPAFASGTDCCVFLDESTSKNCSLLPSLQTTTITKR